ncbi:hypothetical protein BH160DRAFT_1587 [Burkholderia sp. H160]|nr:hypothetical protein BH160DRAFT_1587 [Burkholderia sp. H160]
MTVKTVIAAVATIAARRTTVTLTIMTLMAN